MLMRVIGLSAAAINLLLESRSIVDPGPAPTEFSVQW